LTLIGKIDIGKVMPNWMMV